MPGVSGVTVVTNARVYYTPRAAAGAPGARHSPRPLEREGGMFMQNSGASRGEIAKPCAALSSCHHLRKRVIQYSREVNYESRSRSVLDTRFRGDDDLLWSGIVHYSFCTVPAIPKFRYEIEDGGLASLSPPHNLLWKVNLPPSRSGFRRAARRSAAGPSWFRRARRSSRCRRPSPAPPHPCGGSNQPCRRA
jgi:hypothetical protein